MAEHDGASRRPSGIALVKFCAAILTPESMAGISTKLAKERALEWAKAVDATGGNPIETIVDILPPAEWFQARLIEKRDESDLKAAAKAGGAYGKAYAAILSSIERTRESSGAVEAAIDELWRYSASFLRLETGMAPITKRGERWIPEKKALRKSHQYALDVFFTSVKRRGAAELGPVINSISSGIVVSAAGDWHGGDKPSLYRSGGLSPKAGNGIVVYCPDQKRYYAYFHMADVSVRVGQAVAAGDALGHGGNTGVNARMKGHGNHVHVEIHETDGGALKSSIIRDLIVSIR